MDVDKEAKPLGRKEWGGRNVATAWKKSVGKESNDRRNEDIPEMRIA